MMWKIEQYLITIDKTECKRRAKVCDAYLQGQAYHVDDFIVVMV